MKPNIGELEREGFRETALPPETRSFLHASRAFVHEARKMTVIMSDDDRFEGLDGDVWRHVSFSFPDHMPTYGDMLLVRKIFFPESVFVAQVFPPAELHVNNHPFCLHLWWNKSRQLFPSEMYAAVGIPGLTIRRRA